VALRLRVSEEVAEALAARAAADGRTVTDLAREALADYLGTERDCLGGDSPATSLGCITAR
jgi:plasmid stability protein